MASLAYLQQPVASPFIGVGGPAAEQNAQSASVVIDGTPVRVVVLAISAAIGLAALRTAGFRFNVGVSS